MSPLAVYISGRGLLSCFLTSELHILAITHTLHVSDVLGDLFDSLKEMHSHHIWVPPSTSMGKEMNKRVRAERGVGDGQGLLENL